MFREFEGINAIISYGQSSIRNAILQMKYQNVSLSKSNWSTLPVMFFCIFQAKTLCLIWPRPVDLSP